MAAVDYGPGWHGDAVPYVDALLGALAVPDVAVSVNDGWDLGWELGSLSESARLKRPHLSLRYQTDELLIGPLWTDGGTAGCAVCAEHRSRIATDHPLAGKLGESVHAARTPSPLLTELVVPVLLAAATRPLDVGDLLAVSPNGSRRHRILRSVHCPRCAPEQSGTPCTLRLRERRTAAHPPTRSRGAGVALEPAALRARLLDPRFGPVLTLIRQLDTPFAMSGALLPDSTHMGFGRATSFGSAETVAILEAYERLAGYPFGREVIRATYADVEPQAIHPARFGDYTEAQRNHPTSELRPRDESASIEWVWANRLDDGEPVLVPAEIGFYRYQPSYRRESVGDDLRVLFAESSSGCALGSSIEEAALHSLLELAERDAFLISWFRQRPLPEIDPGTVEDELSQQLLDILDDRGFDAHLLVATWDLGVPVVWACAVNRSREFPAAFSAAGSGVDPLGALRSALWELTQCVTQPLDSAEESCEALLGDPWQVVTLEQHVLLYNSPRTLPVTESCFGGPRVRLDEAFPGWPGQLTEAAGGDVRGGLNFVARCFARAGLKEIAVVDQSTVEHRDLGLSVVKAAVPGIVPMCFGYAHQRLSGLPRLTAAGIDPNRPLPPHPFP